jgi:hypothetical protein
MKFNLMFQVVGRGNPEGNSKWIPNKDNPIEAPIHDILKQAADYVEKTNESEWGLITVLGS